MKKIWVFLLGMLTGAALLLVVALFILQFSHSSSSSSDGVTMFKEAGECLSDKPFKVLQVLEEGAALATEFSNKTGDTELYLGMTVLFVDKGKYYYNDEIIRVPNNKCVRQIGVYTYPTKDGGERTVPIVKITD